MPTVSVIIPTMNEASVIARCIQSACDADEIILADGVSDDETLAIAEKHAVTTVSSGIGRGIQQNAGAAAASSDVLLFLHADNWLSSNCIAQIREAADMPHPVVGAFNQCIDARGIKYRLLEWGNRYRARRRRLPFGDQGIFISRVLFEQLDGFADVPFLEDVMLMQSVPKSQQITVLPGPLYVDARRWKRNGVIRQTLKNRSILRRFNNGMSPEALLAEYRRDDQQRGSN